MLADQALEDPGPATERLGQTAREAAVYLVIGVEEREPHRGTIYNSVLYFGQDGSLLGKHRKLVPTEIERTVWGMGGGSTLQTLPHPVRPHRLWTAASRWPAVIGTTPSGGKS